MLTALFILNDIFHLWAVNTCSDVHKGTFLFMYLKKNNYFLPLCQCCMYILDIFR